VAVYFLLFGLASIVHRDTQMNFKVPQLWNDNVTKLCGSKNQISIDPETANFEKVYISGCIIGVYLGIIIDQRVLGLSKYAYFYETDIKTSLIRLIATFIMGLPFLSTNLLSRDHSYWVVIIVRTWGTPTFAAFYLVGLNKWLCIKLGLANTTDVVEDMSEIEYIRDGIAA
jgi:hypothetical protein